MCRPCRAAFTAVDVTGKLMTEDEAAAVLAAAMRTIAPELDLGAVDPCLPLQEVADIDSLDFLALVADLHERTGIEIPYLDYPKLATLNMFVKYLMSASPHTAPT
jgi:acyl carrier protein